MQASYIDLNISAVIRPDFRRPLKSGAYSLRLFINYPGEKRESYPLHIKVTKTEWERISSHSMFTSVFPKKELIIDTLAKANNIIRLLGDSFTFEDFESKMFGKVIQDYDMADVYATYRAKIDRLNQEGRVGSGLIYLRSMESLRSLRKRLKFHEVNVEFLYRYERYMKRKDCNNSTIGIHLRHFRAIVNMARANGIMSALDYPFGKRSENKYEIPTSRNVKRAIDQDELTALISYEPMQDEAWARDIWLFSFYCNGMNMIDIFNLKWGNIKNGFLYFVREKTKYTARNVHQIELYLIPQAMEIINRWAREGRRKKDKYIFEVYEEYMLPEDKVIARQMAVKAINNTMKRIAGKIGIKNKITTFVARHTWATILMRNNIPVSYISKGLGHTSMLTTEKYLGDFDQDKKREVGSILSSLAPDNK